MLVGQLGQSQLLTTRDIILAQAESLSDFHKDKQKLWIPEPRNLNVSFYLPNAPDNTVNSLIFRAIIEFSSGGMVQRIGPFNAYPGLVVPVHGSWVRVTALGQATSFQVGAIVSYGMPTQEAFTTLGMFSFGGGSGQLVQFCLDGRNQIIDAGPPALTPTVVPFIDAVRVTGTTIVGAYPPVAGANFNGPNIKVTLGDFTTGFTPQETWNLNPGSTDPWHPFPMPTVSIGAQQYQMLIENIIPDLTVVAVQARWRA